LYEKKIEVINVTKNKKYEKENDLTDADLFLINKGGLLNTF